MSLNYWIEMAVERVVCLVCARWFANRGLSVESRRHVNCPRWEAREVWCLSPVCSLRALIWFHFTFTSLVFLPTRVSLSYVLVPAGPFSWLFSPEISSIFFFKRWAFFAWLLFSRWERQVGRWYVQRAVVWHWYLLSYLCVIFSIFYVICFIPSIPFYILKKKSGID